MRQIMDMPLSARKLVIACEQIIIAYAAASCLDFGHVLTDSSI
jgi:hypothetical protein